ncbi:MAG: gamma-glutamyltransferase [Saprospiraceae bacterium]
MIIFKTANIHKILIIGLLGFISCSTRHFSPYNFTSIKHAESSKGMVATAHPLASEVGIRILKKGGNAVDAAIAVQFALAVVYPGAGNIGGGGFLLFQSNDGKIVALDFREKAPRLSTADMYLDVNGNAIDHASKFGPLSSGVPGSVDGMVTAFQDHSKLRNWKALIQPAIDLAENGFSITENEATMLNYNQNHFENNNRFVTAFHGNWKRGDKLVQLELAQTLKLIRDEGRNGFYQGKVAQDIVDEMRANGGLISLEDLSNYHSKWREPIMSNYRGFTVASMPPPSSGGICLSQLLQMVEPYELEKMGYHSTDAVHLMIEAERRVYADRAKHLGDSDFYSVPTKKLLNSAYNLGRMTDFDPDRASTSVGITAGDTESTETTHVSIVDKEGNAVSMTTTLNGAYGSFTVVKGSGFLLNNEMDDFSVKAGVPNMFGLIGAEANKIEPEKRMLSSMTPTIVSKDKKVHIVVGSPGGSTIITSVFQVIVNIIDFKMSVSDTVQSKRFHHQWLPDKVFLEPNTFNEVTQKLLELKGHSFSERDQIGRVEAILIDHKGMRFGASDQRGDDCVLGY